MTAATPRRRTLRARIAGLGLTAATGVLLLFALFPAYWMVITALTPRDSAFSLNPSLVPSQITFDNFIRVITSPNIPFPIFFRNSVIVALGSTAIAVIAGVTGAYAIARLRFRGRRAFAVVLLLIQFFPAVLLVIPLFVILARIGLIDSYLGVILALSTGTLPFNVWLLRGYFLSIPRDLEDAARIDGASYLGVLRRIVLPLAAPGIAAAVTLSFIDAWNDFLLVFVLINSQERRVLSIGLSGYVQQFGTDYTGLFAMATLTTIPVVVVFMLAQRFVVGGLAAGATHG